ncbi:MAG: sigma-54-dependent Fis family transcriptional regulator [Deltaproteobacteria bacterium]|nr:sigma-54-dependent Fis family transcriptional regulator [Deltaproteobacteria bacterium]
MKATILVVDDRPNIREVLTDILNEEYNVKNCGNGDKAIEIFQELKPDIVISDVKMPGMDGMELIKRIRTMDEIVPVILITAYGTIPSAVEAMRIGAYDYLTKPIDYDRLKLVIRRALDQSSLKRENSLLREQLAKKYSLYDNIIGKSHVMQKVFNLVETVASSHSNVLIQGESGTGKELIANAIYYHSTRKHKPMIIVDCSTLPEGLLESELFGHEKGAFSGAVTAKKGRIEIADGGTLYLDEISEMSIFLQAKLLRVLQERQFLRVGGLKPINVDFRLISSTNRDLQKEVECGQFRSDLYYRLNVVMITIPPLRERKEDIPLLVDSFLKKFARREGRTIKSVSRELMESLIRYNWPGNVRELKNCVERMVVIGRSEPLTPEDLPESIGCRQTPPAAEDHSSPCYNLSSIEKNIVQQVLEKTNWNKSAAASLLNIDRKALYTRIKKYKLNSSSSEG